MVENRPSMRGNFVVAFVESVDFCQSEVSFQKIGQGALLELLAVQAPPTSRAGQPVQGEHLEDLIPASPVALEDVF